MARRKKTSNILVKAEKRLTGIKSINPTLNFGDGKSVTKYQAVITNAVKLLETYNTLLSQLDKAKNIFDIAETDVKNWNESMLIAIANKYGKDSSEYEMAGGTRKSERKKPKRKDVNPPQQQQ